MSHFVLHVEIADFVFNRYALKNENEISALQLFAEDSTIGSHVKRSDNIFRNALMLDPTVSPG